MVLGKLVFRGERKKFFLYGENKKKKEISYEKAEKKKKSWRGGLRKNLFYFFSFQIRQQNKQKREHKIFFHTTSFSFPQ